MVTRQAADWGRGAGRLCGLSWVALTGALGLWFCARHRRDARSRAEWLQEICARALRVLGVRVRSRGAPAQGAMIVANHLGYLDILVLSALTPVVFVAKREVRGWPVFGWFAARAGTRFIDRGRRGDVVRVAGELTPIVRSGVSVLVFLEGTSSDGRSVLPFRASLLEPAVCHGWPVAAVGLDYAVPFGRSVEREVCWWGEMTLLPHVLNVLTLAWIKARVTWGVPTEAGVDRKALAAVLRQQVIMLRAAGAELPASERRLPGVDERGGDFQASTVHHKEVRKP